MLYIRIKLYVGKFFIFFKLTFEYQRHALNIVRIY